MLPPALDLPALSTALSPGVQAQEAVQQPLLAFASALDQALSLAPGAGSEPATDPAGERQTAAGEGMFLPFPFAATEGMPAVDPGQTALANATACSGPAAAADAAMPPAQPESPAQSASFGGAMSGHGSQSSVPAFAPSSPLPAPTSGSDLAAAATLFSHPVSGVAQPVSEEGAVRALTSTTQSPNAAAPVVAGYAQILSGETVAAPEHRPTPASSLALNTPDWEPALAERVAWQIGERVQSAHLELNPPDLGPLEVRVRFEGEQARVLLVADTLAARDALESGVPRLRELLGQAGITLLDVSVERHAPGSRESRSYAPPAPHPADAEADTPLPPARAAGLVDDYA